MSVDLSTQYLGLSLANPIVVSSCPLTADIDVLKRLEESGAAAAVMPSLFEEQVRADDSPAAAYAGAPSSAASPRSRYTADYLRSIERAKQSVKIPIIASLNAASLGGWCRHAREMQDAGADAIELNIYFLAVNAIVTAAEIEARHAELVAAVRTVTSIPLAVKIGPYFSALPNVAQQIVAAGADGLVFFNRFLQPDIDVDTLTVEPRLELSSRDELRLPLRWIAILRGQLHASLAATSGVHTAEDVIKLLLAGADATMTASALLRHGPSHVSALLSGVARWLESKSFASIDEIKGRLSQRDCATPAAFERANYLSALSSYDDRL